MTPKDWLEFFITLGPWAPLVLIPWLLWKLRDWNFDRLRQQLRSRSLRGVIAISAIVLTLYYGGWFYLHYNHGLPERFEDGSIGILIAELPHQVDRNGQLIYERALREAFDAAPLLTRRVSIQLIGRPLPEGDQAAHEEALDLGESLNAWYVVRPIQLGVSELTQHSVELTMVAQPDFSGRPGRVSLGRVTDSDLVGSDRLSLRLGALPFARFVVAMALYRSGLYRHAAEALESLMNEGELPSGPGWFDLLFTRASAEFRAGRYRKAEDFALRARELRPEDAATVNNLARVLDAMARYKDAETLLQSSLTTLGQDGPSGATRLNTLGNAYEAEGRYEEAEQLNQRALAIREKALGPEHPSTASSLNNLAWLYISQARYEEAEPLYERALAICEKAMGPEHPDTATSLNGLAWLYHNQGRYEEAEPLYQRALAVREKALGPDHPKVAGTLSNLAVLYLIQGLYEEAETLYQRALAISEKALGPDHPAVAGTLNNLANLYESQGRYEEAEPLYQRALSISEKALGPDHPAVARTLRNYAVGLRAMGREDEAARLESRAQGSGR
jgi:tetratricopeptide (TPR) repeat protein